MRLIDADALVETIDRRHIQFLMTMMHHGSPELAAAMGAYLGLIEDIKNEPTIEPEPPKCQWVKDAVRSWKKVGKNIGEDILRRTLLPLVRWAQMQQPK